MAAMMPNVRWETPNCSGKVLEENIAKKLEIQIGTRNLGNLEVISGLSEGDLIVAEGLKKVRPGGKIKPITN